MELRRLEHFVAVAETRSFTRAAQRMHVVQSALSVSIQALERELGAQLFERTTHQVYLTDAGEALLPEARATIAASVAARDAVDAVTGGMRGTLRLGIMQSLTIVDLASLLARFRREHPGVELRPRPARGGSMELVRHVQSGELDLAFVSVSKGTNPGVQYTLLASEPVVLVAPADHPLALTRPDGGRADERTVRPSVKLSDLAGETFVEVPEGWGTRLLIDSMFARAGMVRDVSIEVADLATLAELVRAGLGLGFLPLSATKDPRGLAVMDLSPELRWQVFLAVPTDRRISAAARAFVELVMSVRAAGDES